MEKIIADLHVHSIASDGSYLPEEVVIRAEALQLKAVALCDHDSVEGLEQAREAGKEKTVELIPAVEISSEIDGKDMHLLGFWIDYRNENLKKTLAEFRIKRKKRAEAILEKLNKEKMPMTIDEVENISKDGSIGRSHIARLMVKKGFVENGNEAFDRFLVRGAPGYVEKNLVTPWDALEMLKEAKAVVSVAHPGLSGIETFLDRLKRHGLDAIEANHPDHKGGQVAYFLNKAASMDLLVTGGSDCHGQASPRGDNMGRYGVTEQQLERLKNRAEFANFR